MQKIRLKFSKTKTLRFIGHLDFLRVFQQTIRRAGLPAAFSQGFNPHLMISFALPLPLGMESLNDYADITLENETSFEEITEKINAAAPSGLIVQSAYPAPNKAASVVAVADYIVLAGALRPHPHKGTRPLDPVHSENILNSENISHEEKTKKILHSEEISHEEKTKKILHSEKFSHEEKTKKILHSEKIIVAKKTKKGIIDADIRADILDLRADGEKIFMRLSAGSARFLNPLIVAKLFFDAPCVSQISRAELFRQNENGELFPL